MASDFNEALLVLAVGMFTVFVILSLVVLSGQLLIKLLNNSGFVLNKIPQKAVVPAAAAATVAASLGQPEQGEHPEQNTLNAIELAIQKWSNGAAQVVNLTNRQTGEQFIINEGQSAEKKAIEAAILQWSHGKANIQSIQKIN